MNTRSLSHLACKPEKIQPSYFQDDSQTTPKKQAVSLKLELAEPQDTLQKAASFAIDLKLDTVIKYKKKPKRPWTPEEDNLLKELVLNKGAREWAFISSFFNERCGKQCRERWHNHLRNGIKKGDWSYEEEWLLFLGVQAYGKRWSIISKFLEGRTENTLKNHWNCKMNPKKDSLTKKLSQLLSKSSSQSFRAGSTRESHLLKLIKAKPMMEEVEMENESQNTKRMIKLFQMTLKNFYDFKHMIYNSYEVETKQKGVKVEDEAQWEWNLIPQFEKIKKETEERGTEAKLKNYDMEEDIGQNHQRYGTCNDFGSESNDFDMKINGSVNAVSQIGEAIFDEEGNEFEEIEMEMNKEKDFDESQSIANQFCSPLKKNIFEGMDFDESNKKRKLFE